MYRVVCTFIIHIQQKQFSLNIALLEIESPETTIKIQHFHGWFIQERLIITLSFSKVKGSNFIALLLFFVPEYNCTKQTGQTLFLISETNFSLELSFEKRTQKKKNEISNMKKVL